MYTENYQTESDSKSAWYDNKAVVIALLFFFFPVGLYAMWKNKKFSNKTKWIVSGFFGFLVLVSGISDNKQATQITKIKTPTAVKTQLTETPVQKQQLQPIADISFLEIRQKMENMTDLQFEEYTKSLKGKRVRWNGYVEDVKEKLFGGYEVLIDMDNPNEPLSVQDITFNTPKEQAVSLQKDSPIHFEGTISSIINILTSLQISLDNAKVLE